MDEPLVEDVAAPETDEPPPPAPVDHPHKKKRGPWLMLALFLIAGLTGFLILQHRQNVTVASAKSAPPPQPGISISTAVAHPRTVGVYINAPGWLAPLSTVTVKSRVDGQLMSVCCRAG